MAATGEQAANKIDLRIVTTQNLVLIINRIPLVTAHDTGIWSNCHLWLWILITFPWSTLDLEAAHVYVPKSDPDMSLFHSLVF